AHDNTRRDGNSNAVISQALPTPRQLTNMPTPINRYTVLRNAVGSTYVNRCDQCSVDPWSANQHKVITGAATHNAMAMAPTRQLKPASHEKKRRKYNSGCSCKSQ